MQIAEELIVERNVNDASISYRAAVMHTTTLGETHFITSSYSIQFVMLEQKRADVDCATFLAMHK